MNYSEYGHRLNPLLHRECPKCEARMWLVVIEPEPYGHEKLVFECSWCRQEEAIVLGPYRASAARDFPTSGRIPF